jgi:hypothetical protein
MDETGAPSPEDTRRQLEGRLEVVEAACARYAAVERLLSSWHWQTRLRQQPEALRELLQHEPLLEEALARIRRRAELEGWPEHLPVLATVRDLRASRARLEALAHKRLGTLRPTQGPPSPREDLARLEALALQPLPEDLKPGEVCLLQGGAEIPLGASLGLITLSLLSLYALFAMSILVGSMSIGFLSALFVHFQRSSGKYWLTRERLLWKPFFGDPVQVPLRSLPTEGVRPLPRERSVLLLGERTVRLSYVEDARRLALLLELHRQPLFLEATDAGYLEDVVCYAATLYEQGARVQRGFVILRPGYVAFVPKSAGRQMLATLLPSSLARKTPIDIPWLVEQLRHLGSGAHFDVALARALSAVNGFRWVAPHARYSAHAPVWKELSLVNGSLTLTGKVGWPEHVVAQRLLENYPRWQGPDARPHTL